uniref:Transmembrane protein n=1 Tax=Kalmanozyma brasiliensis (strain GHG001) TaxID=1365824 RepID=V5ER49_KALBG
MASASCMAIHLLGVVILWFAAVINFLVHPLTIRSTAVSTALIGLSGLIVAQELSACRRLTEGSRKRSPHFCRALCFLVASAMTFDRLSTLPCDVQAKGPSHPVTSSKLPVPTPGAMPNITAATGPRTPPPTTQLGSQKSPPAFGTAVYLVRPLAPHCVKIDAVPGQAAGSVAWVNVSVNKTSQMLTYTACAASLAISVVYLISASLCRPGAARNRQDDGASLQPLHLIVRDKGHVGQTKKEPGSDASQPCVIDLHGYDTDYAHAVDFASGCIAHQPIFGQGKGRNKTSGKSARLFTTLSPPDFSRGNFGEAAGLTPRMSSRGSARNALKSNEDRQTAERLHEEKPLAGPAVLCQSVAGDVTGIDDGQTPAHIDVKSYRAVKTAASSSGISSKEDPAAHDSDRCSPSVMEPKAQCSHTESRIDCREPPEATYVTAARPDTADSACTITSDTTRSVLDQRRLSSRPGTGTSAKSTTSCSQVRRRRGLFAALHLQLGSRLSGVSQDASMAGGTYDTQGSLSARTFGNGGQDSPIVDIAPPSPAHCVLLSTPKALTAETPM